MWFFYALLGAVSKSYSGFFRKKMASNISAAMYMWLSYMATVLVLSPVLFMNWAQIIYMFQHSLLIIVGAALTIMIATLLNLEALKREELSYTAPLNAFVPVFTLIIAILFLNERLHLIGIVGILVIVAGAYIINIKSGRSVKWYTPLARLFTNTGARLSLAVAFTYAINTVLLKMLSNQSYDSFSIMYVTTAVGLVLLFYVPLVKRDELQVVARSKKSVVLGAATSSFLGSFFHILALAGTHASYAVSVRRLEAPISVLLGWRLLKETNIRNKLIGSALMTVGVVIIALF